MGVIGPYICGYLCRQEVATFQGNSTRLIFVEALSQKENESTKIPHQNIPLLLTNIG